MYSIESQRENIRLPRISSKTHSNPRHLTPNPIDNLTAKAWLYASPKSQFGFKTNLKRQIASLTKIMTALCAVQICEKYGMNIKGTYLKVTRWAACVIGTSANLQEDAWLTIEDLLYGLMLPSGNDAATVLAENLGAVIYFDRSGNKSMIQGRFIPKQLEIRSIDLTEDLESIRFYNQQFIAYMNSKAKQLQMYRTRFSNPHGLDHLNNYSTCEDILIMAQSLVKNPLLAKIVNSPTHKGTFKFFTNGKVVPRHIYWSNTNKLLGKQDIVGIKTGVTNKAGGCLVTSFVFNKTEIGFMVVLGCASTQLRFKDTLKILSWARDEEDLSTTA